MWRKWVVNGCAYNEESKEDIEELKRLFYSDRLTQYGKRKLINHYEQQIQELKEIEQIHRQENGELREKVKELEEERQIVGMPVRNKRDGRIGIVLHQWKSGSVAVLESINPRVINTHDSWNTLEIVTDEVKQTQTKCETIPVSLVKEKIKELKEEGNYKTLENPDGRVHFQAEPCDYKIQVLEELLEKRK